MDRKSYKLVLLATAQRELEEVAQVHYQLVGAASARKITDKIYRSLERLEQFSLSGVQLDDRELRNAGYRMVISGEYVCVYRVMGEAVYIYHIVHGATEYPRLVKGNH